MTKKVTGIRLRCTVCGTTKDYPVMAWHKDEVYLGICSKTCHENFPHYGEENE